MDRSMRRERARVEAKHTNTCSACRQAYESKSCFATYSGTFRGKWVHVCHECMEKGLIDEIHGVGIHTKGDINAPGFQNALEVLRPFLQNKVTRVPLEQQAELVAAYRAEDPSAQVFFPDANGKFRAAT